jgi:molybdopterin synthase catalytic subunit
MAATVRLQREPFDAAAEAAKLRHGRTDVGALVTFTGICRGEEARNPLLAMTLEHYPGMAEAEVARHVQAAEQRWPLLGVTAMGGWRRARRSSWSPPPRRIATRRLLPPSS